MSKAVIFDLDGTLLNTLKDIAGSVNYALKIQGYKTYSDEEILFFIGDGVKKVFERALPSDTKKEIIENSLKEFKKHYEIHCRDFTSPYDGILELLLKLKNDGVNMAVVSNKYHHAVNILGEFFKDYMNIFIGESETILKKPSPLGIIHASRLLDVSFTDVIYVGDTMLDYQTANNANVKCILVSWGYSKIDLGLQNKVEVANSPEELYKKISVLNC